MKKYTLTIEYDENTEEIEYISEEIVSEDNPIIMGDVDISEYFDEDLLEYIEECYIIGKA
jgi:hypothetical protein